MWRVGLLLVGIFYFLDEDGLVFPSWFLSAAEFRHVWICRQRLKCSTEGNGSMKALTSAHAPISFFSGGVRLGRRTLPHCVLSGWSGADERLDYSAMRNARCVDGLRKL